MKIHFVRNATLVVETGDNRILVDPCLAKKGTLPPFTLFRRPPRRNPLVEVPETVLPLLRTVTGGLVTHCRFGHWDHLDSKGARLLAELKVPVYCGSGDVRYLEKKGIRAVGMVPEKARPFLNGRITPVAAEHGKGIIRRFMGPGLGFFLDLPGEPSLYIAGDTVLTARVREVLQNLRPQVAIVNAGSAVLDIGKPILMPLDEIIEFVQTAPGVVVAVHMNAVNHCMTDRKTLKAKLLEMNLSEKVWIPEEGETLSLQADGSCSIPLDRGAL